eukprot:jgi/Bigna1/68615/fgenesh1_pg.6_\
MHFLAPLVLACCATAAPSMTSTRGRLSKAINPQSTKPHYKNALKNIARDVSRKAGKEILGEGTAPMGKFWDPAGFTKDLTPNQLRQYREAELTHGRVAMLGALGFLTQEAFHPLFGGNIDGPAVNHFEEITKIAPGFWYPVLLAIALAELGRARLGWQDPGAGGAMFSLRDGYEPGDLGFDPLGLKPGNPAELASIKNKELNNGRLAMLALAGFMAQELVNGKPIIENLQG